jgi:hypothetical protein
LTAIVAFVGAIAMEARVADVTVSVAVFVIDPSAAVMVAVPALAAVASPLVAPVLMMVATAMFDDVQTADAVMSWLDPSLKFPVAANCFLVPRASCTAVGIIVMDVSVAAVTVNVVVPETVPRWHPVHC